MSRFIPGTPAKRLNTLLFVLPFLLLLFYFRAAVSRFIIYDLFMMHSGDKLPSTIVFFISTLLKIVILLVAIIFIMAMVRTFFPVEKVRKQLSGMADLPATIMAGIFGVLTPFCSCSAVPMFISFLEAGIPLGMTFTFLIASPLVNEIILIMLAGLFGIKVALIYLAAGLSVAVLSGLIIGRLRLERHLPPWMLEFRNARPGARIKINADTLIYKGYAAVFDILKRTWIYILAGIAAGSIIHGYVPDDFLAGIGANGKWYSLPLTVLAGIPLYSCSASVAPVAFSLADKGMPLGNALAFIMAVAGLSIPEFVILKKVLSFRLIAIFTGIVFTGIVIVGFLFNRLF